MEYEPITDLASGITYYAWTDGYAVAGAVPKWTASVRVVVT